MSAKLTRTIHDHHTQQRLHALRGYARQEDRLQSTMDEQRTSAIALGSAILITLAMALVVAALWGMGIL